MISCLALEFNSDFQSAKATLSQWKSSQWVGLVPRVPHCMLQCQIERKGCGGEMKITLPLFLVHFFETRPNQDELILKYGPKSMKLRKNRSGQRVKDIFHIEANFD